MTYTPPHLRDSESPPTGRSSHTDDLIRRRKHEYATAGAPAGGPVDKKRIAPNVYFFRRTDGTEGLGIWWTAPGASKVSCARLPGMPTVAQATREAQRRRAGVLPAPASDRQATVSVPAPEAASRYLDELRADIRADGPAGSNDTRPKTITQSTWDKKRSAFSTLGLLSDVDGRYPYLIGTGRSMIRRERDRCNFDAMTAEERRKNPYDPGPLAHLTIGELDATALVEAIQYLIEHALKPGTVVSYLQQMRPFIRDCVRQDLIAVDPFTKLSERQIPQLTNLRKRALTQAEQHRLLQALPEGQHQLGVIFDVSVGPRIGERLSLVWDDFDLDVNRVSIDSSRTRSDPHGRLKTAAGIRNPPFPDAVGDLLRAWREQSPASAPHDPVWCTPDGRAYTPDAFRKKIIAPAIQMAGLNDGLDRTRLEHAARWVTQHSLRHTFASMLLRNPTIDLATAAMLLGHADTTVTQRVYFHFIHDDRYEHPVRETIAAHVRQTFGENLIAYVGLAA